MKTKYDWSNVPDDVKWIATDSDGDVFGFNDIPTIFDDYMWFGSKPIFLKINKSNSCWQDSLEERPK